jgi:hypothetical protein
MNRKEISNNTKDWVYMAQRWDCRGALVNAALNLWVP